MNRSAVLIACLGGAALAFAPLAAPAQSASAYVAPKMLKRAEAGVPVAGPGTVVVKVLVNADGSFKVQNVIRSTNHGDDKAALDIARNSTYQPALRNGKPAVGFYDFTLSFKGSAVGSGDSASIAAVYPYEQMIRAGKYASAKAGLQSYLAKNPSASRAEVFLGVADAFMGDNRGAVAAFEKAGPIPAQYKAIAIKAYSDDVMTLTNAKDYAAAVPVARKAVTFQPGYGSYDNLAFAELSSGDAASAAVDFEKARSLAASQGAPANQHAIIDVNLAAAYVKLGDLVKAKTVADEAKKLDPSATGGYAAIENAYAAQAEAAQKAGKNADAASLYEQAAAIAPADAVTLYVNAAFAYLQEKPKGAYDLAKADADKALAIDANSAAANFAEGVSLANAGKHDEAVTYLNKADAAAKTGNDPALTASIEKALKQLSGS